MKPELTIVIITYNLNAELKRCLLSLLPQLTSQCEVILVDDGSDQPAEETLFSTLINFSSKSYVYQQNKGVASARNTGIENARGKFITFLDADDWVGDNYISESLLVCGRLTDTRSIGVSLNIKDAFPDNKIVKWPFDNLASTPGDNFFVLHNKPLYYCWGKIYHLQLIKDNNVSFHDFHYAEDMVFNLEYCALIKSVSLYQAEIFYFQNSKGLTKVLSQEKVQQRFAIADYSKNKFGESSKEYNYILYFVIFFGLFKMIYKEAGFKTTKWHWLNSQYSLKGLWSVICANDSPVRKMRVSVALILVKLLAYIC